MSVLTDLRNPAVIKLWDNAWAEVVPFPDYHVGGQRIICSTNANESLNVRHRRPIKARGHFPFGRETPPPTCPELSRPRPPP
jgi:transposase-like protein